MSYSKGPIEGLGYIYRYLLDDKVMYVGQTKDLDKRIKQHSKETKFYNLTNIEFQGCLEQNLNDVEAYYINLYNPPLNKTHPRVKNKNINEVINHLFNWEKYKGQTNFNIEPTDYIPVKTAATLKGVSLQAIYKRIDAGTLPMVIIGGKQCVPKNIILKEAKINNNNNIQIASMDYDDYNIILFLLDALEEQKEGQKSKYINLIQRYFGVTIDE